jgi:hypothetical protein
MSLHDSMEVIRDNLKTWSAFPKYALERRLDIFLTPFLTSYVADRNSGRVTMVTAEFPILASHGPKRRKSRAASDKPPPKWLTVNADYLFHVVTPGRTFWLLVELKTDASSFEVEQLALYQAARALGMPSLLADLRGVEGASTRKEKYTDLRKHIAKGRSEEADLEIAYLAPAAIREEDESFYVAEAPREDGEGTRLLTLEDFRAWGDKWCPKPHQDLWHFVRSLLPGAK